MFSNYQITKTDLPSSEFIFPQNFQMYYSHLESLNLVFWTVYEEDYLKNERGVQIGLIKHSRMGLTEFGSLFVKACLPEKGFAFVKNETTQK